MKKYLIIGLLFCACNPVKKALRVANSSPNEFAAFCAEKFPAGDTMIVHVDSTKSDTLILKSDPVTEYVTINDTVYKTVKTPGTTYFVTKTVKKDSLVIRVDNAAVAAKQKQINDLIVVNKDLVVKNDKANWWKKACLITWGILLLIAIVWFLAKRYKK